MLILIPVGATETIRAGGRWGALSCRISHPDNIGAVVGISTEHGATLPVQIEPKGHFLSHADPAPVGRWYRVDQDLQAGWVFGRRREAGPTLSGFKSGIEAGYLHPGGGAYLAVTYAPSVTEEYVAVGVPELAAWHVSGDGVVPIDIDVQPAEHGMNTLAPGWPV